MANQKNNQNRVKRRPSVLQLSPNLPNFDFDFHFVVDDKFPKCDCGFRHCKRIHTPKLYTVSKLVLRLSVLCFSGCCQHIFHRRETLVILGGTWTILDPIFHQYHQRTNYKQNSLLYMCFSPFLIILVISGFHIQSHSHCP